MSRDSAREAITKYKADGGITSNQSPTDVQSSVAADIAKHDNPQAPATAQVQAPATGATVPLTQPDAPVNDAKAAVSKVQAGLADALDKSATVAARASDRISAQPTPGSIATLLIVLFVLVFILIPVDKNKLYSRAQLLFLSLVGHTTLKGHRTINTNQSTPVPVAGAEGDAAPFEGGRLVVDSLYQEPLEVDATAQYQDTPEDNELSPYWDEIDNIGTEYE